MTWLLHAIVWVASLITSARDRLYLFGIISWNYFIIYYNKLPSIIVLAERAHIPTKIDIMNVRLVDFVIILKSIRAKTVAIMFTNNAHNLGHSNIFSLSFLYIQNIAVTNPTLTADIITAKTEMTACLSYLMSIVMSHSPPPMIN